ncbi:MAG: hypothetical protein JXA54_03430 [Candidatus Heimdallarchaeota archaeon]|nr:hypothetical protein [Candidatus Heimdallarchaeota archaeon]
MNKEPQYLNSWKGQVLKALIVDRLSSFVELQITTGLDESALNKALSELLTLEIIAKFPKGYYVRDPTIIEEYINYFAIQESSTENPPKFSSVKDIKHVQLVDYVVKKPLLNNTVNIETEYRTNYFYSGNYIDVLKWVVERNRLLIAIFEVKPQIDDIGNTIRQIKNYCHQLRDPRDPKFGTITNKHIISYLVVDATVQNFAIFHDFRNTFRTSGLDFMMFVDITRNEDMLISAKSFQFNDLDQLSKWVRR